MDAIIIWRIVLVLGTIIIWRIVLVLGTLGFLGAMGIFTLKLIAASTGRKRLIDLFIR